MSEIFGFDAYAPKEIAERVQSVGVAKARSPLLTQLTSAYSEATLSASARFTLR